MHLRQWQGNEMTEIETRGTIPASACTSSTSASFINCTYPAWKARSWGVHGAAGQSEGSAVFGVGWNGENCAVNLHLSSCISEWSWDARDSSGKHKNFSILIFTSSFYASDSNLSDGYSRENWTKIILITSVTCLRTELRLLEKALFFI